MTTTITNRHERALPLGAEQLGPALDALGSATDRLWPRHHWPTIELAGDLGVGVEGRHGPIRYRLTQHRPGRLLHFTFLPSLTLEPRGHHRFELHPVDATHCLLRHELQLVDPSPGVSLLWQLIIEPLHDALIEDLLDNAAALAGSGTVKFHDAHGADRPAAEADARRSRWSRRVRLTRPVAVPALTLLGGSADYPGW